jgi:hypothetical protein
MTPLHFLNEAEVNFDRGEICVNPFFGKYALCGVISFLLFIVVIVAIAVASGSFGLSLFVGILGAVAVPAAFHAFLRREVKKINGDRRQPHKVFPEIVDWEEGDKIELVHFGSRRFEYVGVTDDFRVIIGKDKRISSLLLEEKYSKKEKYKDIFTVPALYLRRYTEKNHDLEKRMTEKRKENLLENRGTYQEYLNTVSQEKKKLNGNA